jgi:hypothetical protein
MMVKKIRAVTTKQISLLLLILLNFTHFACKKDEPPYIYKCRDGFIEFQNVTSLTFAENLNLNDSLVTLVIQSEEQLNRNFSNARGKYDFEKNTILAGRYKAPNMDKVVKQSVKSFCAYNVLSYDIQLQSGMLPTSIKVPFFALISKIPDNATVQFHVHY